MSFNDYKFSPVSLIEMIPIVSQIYMGYIYSHKIFYTLSNYFCWISYTSKSIFAEFQVLFFVLSEGTFWY